MKHTEESDLTGTLHNVYTQSRCFVQTAGSDVKKLLFSRETVEKFNCCINHCSIPFILFLAFPTCRFVHTVCRTYLAVFSCFCCFTILVSTSRSVDHIHMAAIWSRNVRIKLWGCFPGGGEAHKLLWEWWMTDIENLKGHLAKFQWKTP